MAIGAAAASDGRPAGLGLQRRIMLYVAVGLSIMFGVLAFLGLGAIDQATELVFNERLASAHTTASTLERELGGVATDVREEATELFANTDPGATGGAERLLSRFPPGDSSPFFRVSGLWILDSAGRLLSQAGDPGATAASESAVAGAAASVPAAGSAILAAVAPVNGETAFAAVIARLDRRPGEPEVLVVVHTVSINSTADYRPATHGQPVAAGDPESPPHSSASDAYHLEVIDPDGSVVLGIGADERPGQLSRHFQAISSLVRAHGAATLLHEPDPDNPAESHVMAVVPVSETPFYLVLEQPVDIALALPQDLRERLVLTIVLGFVATLAVAWITTRHVVKPTEQLTAAAQRMARGDLDSPIAVAAQDEIGRLAESLDTMRRHLRLANAATEATNRELESRVAERTARLGEVLRKTISAQEEERHRLARELHDETAQTLAALSIALDRARDSLAAGEPAAERHIQDAKSISTRLLEETRRMILGLRPAVLDDLGLVPAVRWLCETVLGDRGVEVTVDEHLGTTRLPAHIEVALFRIVQEAVTNVARHAGAKHAMIHLARTDGTVMVQVSDDGKGFDVGAAMGPKSQPESVGLVGMQERVALLNGSMEVASKRDSGTTVTVRIQAGDAAP